MILLLVSCQKDYSPLDVSIGGGTGGTSLACKDCLYFPTCDGSVYTYRDSSAGGTPTTTPDTVRYVKDSAINGINFRKVFFTSNRQQYSFLSCAGGIVTTIAYNPTSQGGSTVQKLEITVLKYLAPAGTQWTDTLNVQGQQIIYKNTLIEKNISFTVAGRLYPDVMHVTNLTGQVIPLVGFTALVTTEYYFAKNVGLIESVSTSTMTGDVILKHSLQSYSIP
jgi:hypothetical protein